MQAAASALNLKPSLLKMLQERARLQDHRRLYFQGHLARLEQIRED